MGRALEVITGFTTGAIAAFTGWTMAAGNSLTIRNAPLNSRVSLLQAWADFQFTGTLRIRSPKLHDANSAIRLDVTVGDATPMLPFGIAQPLFPQDILVAEQTSGAAAGDVETGAFLVYHEDLPGASAMLITEEELLQRGVNILANENTLALGTAGGYSGEEAINTEIDNFKGNTWYALVGYLCDTECAVVRWRGSDTGNLGVGGPGNETLRHVTADWFRRLSRHYKLPLIPVFNAANKGGFLIDGAQDENGADVTVTSIFVELSQAPAAR